MWHYPYHRGRSTHIWNAPSSQIFFSLYEKTRLPVGTSLTESPSEIFIMQFQCLLPQLARHLMDAFNRIHYAVDRVQLRLRPGILMNWQQKETHTPTAESKASFHEPRVSFAFAHSLKSGGRVM
ncbi:hypothetical protein EV363DRAFT_1173003 [Boletus edulis]|nr:hypothetical protein EV363DRAFT_1173003 [Boletus edulis]